MLFKDTDGDKFEDLRSLIQELTFVVAQSEFKKYDIEFTDIQMKTLGLTNIKNIYTNLGLLLSDQCMHTIKAAVFSGLEKTTFKDRREFSGSILKQLENAFVISLPNLNEQSIQDMNKSNKGIPKPNVKTLLDYLDSNGRLKRKDAEKLLHIGQTSAGKMLAEMVKANKIQISGSGRNTLYILPDDNR